MDRVAERKHRKKLKRGLRKKFEYIHEPGKPVRAIPRRKYKQGRRGSDPLPPRPSMLD